MGTRINRYYNNPAIGEAFGNIASIFAPPEATDILAYAQAAKARQETQGLSDLYGLAADPNADMGRFDKLGAATGQWNPSQGYHAIAVGDATDRLDIATDSADSRYGTDSSFTASRLNNADTNATTLATNANTVRGNAITGLYGALNEGQIRPAVPDEMMAAIGLPGVDPVTGLPKPKTVDNVQAELLAAAVGENLIGPADAAMKYGSDIPVEEIVDAAGTPRIVTRSDAIGQTPYDSPGSAAAMVFKTYTTPDGRTGTARLDPNGAKVPVDATTGEPLPEGTITGDITDSKQGMTTAVASSEQMRAGAITNALTTIDQLQSLINANPAAQGIAGTIRGTAQDVMQTGGELSTLFGGTIDEVLAAAAKDPSLQAIVPQMYDPNIPAIQMLENVLAWQYAKTFAGDRVTNEQLSTARQAIGAGSIFANQASSNARLGALRQSLQTEGQRLAPRLPNTMASDLTPLIGQAAPPPAPVSNTPRPRATNAAGDVMEFDGTAWVPVPR